MDIENIANDEAVSPENNRKAWKAWKVTSTTGMMIGLFEEYPEDETVMLGVAWNPVTPNHILQGLTHSRFPRVKSAAEQRLGV